MVVSAVLLTIAGSALGITLGLAVRRLRRARTPLRLRKRRIIGIPLSLAIAVAAMGGAVVLDPRLVAGEFPTSLVLPLVSVGWTWLILRLPGWWRVLPVLLLAVPIVPAVDLWRHGGTQAGAAAGGVECTAGDLVADPRDPVGPRAAVGESGTDVALLRIDPGDTVLRARILPLAGMTRGRAGDGEPAATGAPAADDAALGPAEGPWTTAVALDRAGQLSVTVRIEGVSPVLWWFPTAPRFRAISLSGADETVEVVTQDTRLPVRRWLDRLGLRRTRTLEVTLPEDGADWLQPGVFLLEYRCRGTDTQDV